MDSSKISNPLNKLMALCATFIAAFFIWVANDTFKTASLVLTDFYSLASLAFTFAGIGMTIIAGALLFLNPTKKFDFRQKMLKFGASLLVICIVTITIAKIIESI